ISLGVFRGSMNFIPVKYQLAFGLTTIVTTTLMVLITFDFGPDAHQATRDGRKRLTEAIAINSSMQLSQNDLKRIETLLSAMVDRDPQLLSAAVTREGGTRVLEIGDHSDHWTNETNYSTDSQVQVPLVSSGAKWGTIQFRFTPIETTNLTTLLRNPWTKFVGLTALVVFGVFSLFLRYTLKQLDPKKAIPKRVQFALDNIAEGLLVTDKRGRVLLANEAFAKWTNLRSEQLIGFDARHFAWNVMDESDTNFPWLAALSEERAQAHVMMGMVDTQGNSLALVAHSSPLLGNDGRYRGVMTSFEDITTLEHHKVELSKAKDAADEANQAKSDFLARMSHEIRTPMNAILGYTDVLRRGMVDNESQREEHLLTIHQSGEHLLALINDILDLSKIEAGKMEIELTDVSLLGLVGHVMSVLKIKAEEKSIYLKPEFSTPLPRTVRTDAVRVRQSLINLIGNAIKFTERGGVRLVVRMTRGKRPQLAFDIVDTGIGLTPEAMQKIFDPFSQADASITRRFGGTGLGLSISVQIAERLGGKLSVASEVGRGSIFTLKIDPGDLSRADFVAPDKIDLEGLLASEDPADDQQPHLRLPESTILVVDDGESNRRLISLYLKRAGVEVIEAENGVEAIEIADQVKPDLILMDMHMPVMDGFEATKRLRQQGFGNDIIALTADVMKDDERRCREAGCSGFLTKPISLTRLMAALTDSLGSVQGPHEEERQLAEIQSDVDALQVAVASASPIVSSLPMDDPEFHEIVLIFVDRLQTQTQEMVKATQEKDFDRLGDLGHWLKGAAGTVGFEQFTASAGSLESSARLRDIEGVSRSLREIQDIAARIEVAPLGM
ncbi:MAG: response regulator, partial [Planctomycetota bacterium]